MGHVPAILNFSNCNVQHMQRRCIANVNFGQERKNYYLAYLANTVMCTIKHLYLVVNVIEYVLKIRIKLFILNSSDILQFVANFNCVLNMTTQLYLVTIHECLHIYSNISKITFNALKILLETESILYAMYETMAQKR